MAVMTRSSKALLPIVSRSAKAPVGDDREHVFTQGLKVFCSHWQPP
jgi:hypothetical protein